MQQRLLVKFSCDPHKNILLRDLLAVFLLSFVLSDCYNNFTKYYDLKFGLDCNLGKNLSKNEENDQLVKYKDTK